MNQAEYQQIGLPPSLSERIARLDAHWDAHNSPLPYFLLRAYIGEHLTRDSSGKVLVNSGKVIAACGAVCEIGGLIGGTTAAAPSELLQADLDVNSLPKSPEALEPYWRDVCQRAAAMLKLYRDAYGTKPPGVLPLHVESAYFNSGLRYSKDITTIKREHDRQIDFKNNWQIVSTTVHTAFAVGIALARNHRGAYTRIQGICADDKPGPSTMKFKNPQSQTNITIGNLYSYQDQLHLGERGPNCTDQMPTSRSATN